MFNGNTVVKFDGNTCTAYYGGGEIYAAISAIASNGNANLTFINNRATPEYFGRFGGEGGAIIIQSSTITFNGSTLRAFESNMAYNGGAIYGSDESTVEFDGNKSTTFANNGAIQLEENEGTGGAISIERFVIAFYGNTSVKFDSNMASNGGAISGA